MTSLCKPCSIRSSSCWTRSESSVSSFLRSSMLQMKLPSLIKISKNNLRCSRIKMGSSLLLSNSQWTVLSGQLCLAKIYGKEGRFEIVWIQIGSRGLANNLMRSCRSVVSVTSILVIGSGNYATLDLITPPHSRGAVPEKNKCQGDKVDYTPISYTNGQVAGYMYMSRRWRTRQTRNTERGMTICRSYSRQAVNSLCETIMHDNVRVPTKWKDKMCLTTHEIRSTQCVESHFFNETTWCIAIALISFVE